MASGKRPRQSGFTYIAMLMAVAIIGIGLAATGQVWSAANQRERERELLFIGHEFRNAIQQYYEQTPGGVKRFPTKLEDLTQDKRYPTVHRYLRKVYRDPMTGKSDWGLVMAPGGGVQGVYSLSEEHPIKRAGFDPADLDFQGASSIAGWRFMYVPPVVISRPAQAGSGLQGNSAIGVQGNSGLGVQGNSAIGVQGNSAMGVQGNSAIGAQGNSQ